MPRAVFGTAHLFGDALGAPRSYEVLEAAIKSGFTAFDTAPSYGHGASEPAVGEMVRSRDLAVTTKVGINPAAPASAPVRWAKAAARRLPEGVVATLRSRRPAGHGRFAIAEVRASVEQSLARLGRIERLMLHEVRPDEITEELLLFLSGYCERGDVGELGVATGNRRTLACLNQAPGQFQVAHVQVGPFAPEVRLPASVTARVGHGVFGPGGAALKRLSQAATGGTDEAQRWRAVTAGTPWTGSDGLATVLLARVAAMELTDVIVATSRPAGVPHLLLALTGDQPDPTVLAALEDLIAAAKRDQS